MNRHHQRATGRPYLQELLIVTASTLLLVAILSLTIYTLLER